MNQKNKVDITIEYIGVVAFTLAFAGLMIAAFVLDVQS